MSLEYFVSYFFLFIKVKEEIALHIDFQVFFKALNIIYHLSVTSKPCLDCDKYYFLVYLIGSMRICLISFVCFISFEEKKSSLVGFSPSLSFFGFTLKENFGHTFGIGSSFIVWVRDFNLVLFLLLLLLKIKKVKIITLSFP